METILPRNELWKTTIETTRSYKLKELLRSAHPFLGPIVRHIETLRSHVIALARLIVIALNDMALHELTAVTVMVDMMASAGMREIADTVMTMAMVPITTGTVASTVVAKIPLVAPRPTSIHSCRFFSSL